jgi:MFS family permease
MSTVYATVRGVTVANRFGRKPILLSGLCSSAITTVVFGLSTSLPMAIVTRMINGLANGNLGIAKSYLREITDETNQAKCAGVLSLAWGAGVIIGPLLGGLLSQPALKYAATPSLFLLLLLFLLPFQSTSLSTLLHRYPSLFPADGVFASYPYLLPCIIAGSIAAVGFLFGFKFLGVECQRRTSACCGDLICSGAC